METERVTALADTEGGLRASRTYEVVGRQQLIGNFGPLDRCYVLQVHTPFGDRWFHCACFAEYSTPWREAVEREREGIARVLEENKGPEREIVLGLDAEAA